jgi:hypothetical protein
MWSAHVPRQRKAEKVLVFLCVCVGGGVREIRRRERRTSEVRHIHNQNAIKCAEKPEPGPQTARIAVSIMQLCSTWHAGGAEGRRRGRQHIYS